MREVQMIAGIAVTSTTMEDEVNAIVERAAHSDEAFHIHLANTFTIALATSDPEYFCVLSDPGSIVLPDGKPLGWLSALRRDRPAITQVRGPSLFLKVFEAGLRHDIRHYLLGGRPEVLERLRATLVETFPGLSIVGAESPPFRPATDAELRERDERIQASGAQIVWVGLGTPKQDYEVMRITHSLSINSIAVGAAFDFAAGTLPTAPGWMTAVGLEWVFRLASEPKRLWRRYLFGNSKFLLIMFHEILARPRASAVRRAERRAPR